MIKNKEGNVYIGITDDPQRRLFEHNSKHGAIFTKEKSNFEIIFLENYKTLKEARNREIQIKKWRREKKEMLIKRYGAGLVTHMNT